MASNQESPLYLIESPSKAEQVAQTIRTQVATGELRHGQALASTRQLAADFHVSVGTITGAIQILEGEGLVISRPRSGRAIHAPEQDAALGRGIASSPGDGDPEAGDDGSLASEVRALREMVEGLQAQVAGLSGRKAPLDDPGPENSVTTTCKVVTELRQAPPEIARELRLARGAAVVRKHEILYRDGSPVCASTAWLTNRHPVPSPVSFQETNWMVHGPGGHSSEAITGRLVAEEVYEEFAREATRQDADWLSVPVGSPVSAGRVRRRDLEKNPLEYIEWVAAPGVWSSHRPPGGRRR